MEPETLRMTVIDRAIAALAEAETAARRSVVLPAKGEPWMAAPGRSPSGDD
jgi:hypothetical protein